MLALKLEYFAVIGSYVINYVDNVFKHDYNERTNVLRVKEVIN